MNAAAAAASHAVRETMHLHRGAVAGLSLLAFGGAGCELLVSGGHQQNPTGSGGGAASSTDGSGGAGTTTTSSSTGVGATGGAGGAGTTTASSGAGTTGGAGGAGTTTASSSTGVGATGGAGGTGTTTTSSSTGGGSATCAAPGTADGTPCNDGPACTVGNTCNAGACTGGAPVVCSALDACHYAGTCDAVSGTCSNPVMPHGITCDDGDACTVGDTCVAGTCIGGSPVVCSGGVTCVAGTCAPPTTTWADCSVGLDPTRNGGDLLWVEQAQLPWSNSPGGLWKLALGPTGDIALGLLASAGGMGGSYLTAGYQRLNGSGNLFAEGEYTALNGGASDGFDWYALSIASNNDLVMSIGAVLGCGPSPMFNTCPGSVASFHRQGAPGSASSAGQVGCNNGGPYPVSYCHETIDDTLTPTGQLTSPVPGIPDGLGGAYVSGGLYSTLDLGCGPMVPASSASGYLAHLGPGSSCIYSHVLPVVASVVADASGAVLSASSSVSLDLGCGALATAAGGSTLIAWLDPAGGCRFARSLAAPGLAVVLDPSGSAVVSGLVGAAPLDLGGGPLAPLGSKDVVLGELGASGNPLWSKRFGGPGVTLTGSHVSVSAAGDVYLRTAWSGSINLGGGAISAATSDTVVGSYTPSGAHRWSRGFPIAGLYAAGIDGCGSLVVASNDYAFDPGNGTVLPLFPIKVTTAIARFAP